MLKRFKASLSLQIILGILLGVGAGLIFGPRIAVTGELGKLFITLIKTVAAPLVFFAIVEAILKSDIQLRNAASLFKITAINATFAALIGLGLSNLFKPGQHLVLTDLAPAADAPSFVTEKMNIVKVIQTYIPQSLVQPFSENSIIMIVILAIFLGAAVRVLKSGKDASDLGAALVTFEQIIEVLLKVHFKILEWVIKITPFAVFGVVAKTVGEYGFAPFKGLLWYVGVGLLALALQPLLVYHSWIKFVKGWKLKFFWKQAKDPVLFGIGSNSSLATLPLTLKALDNLGVSKGASRLGACVGTNLNNDGILLYEAMAVLFVAQFHGFDLSAVEQIQAAFICVIAAIGIAGVPEAGIVSLSLVLTSVGLPLEILPLLLTVDWILARGRTVVNVLADMTVSCLLDKKIESKMSF